MSGSRDYTARLWDARVGGQSLSSLDGHMNEVTSVQWHSNGYFVLSAARDSQIKVSNSNIFQVNIFLMTYSTCSLARQDTLQKNKKRSVALESSQQS